MKSLTASRLDLVDACSGAFGLPWRDDRTADSDAGRENHAEYERAILVGDIPEALTQAFPGVTQWFAETKIAYDIAGRSAVVLGHGTDRNYTAAPPMSICGTCDVYGIDGDTVVVVDWKLKNYISAAENRQLRFYALALCLALGKHASRIAIFPEVGAPSLASFDLFDFSAFQDDLHRLYLKASAPNQVYIVGEHCRYCPGFMACPETTRELALVSSGATPVQVDLLLPLETDEQAARAYQLYLRLAQLTARVRAAVYARGGERPIPLGNGRVFGSRPTQGKRQIDGDKAYEMIRQKYGQKAADAAVTRETTQVAIVEALTTAGVKSPKAEKEQLMKALEQAGGITRKDGGTVDEHEAVERLKGSEP